MAGVIFTPTLELPVKTIPWDRSGSYPQRVLRWLRYTRRWRFSKDWYFCLFDGEWVKIPKDFVLDGASIPKPFRSLLSPTGILFIAGCFHDYAYEYDKLIGVKADDLGGGSFVVLEEYDYQPGAGREYWDWMFKQITYQVTGLCLIPNITYMLLVLFGSFAWGKHRKQDKKQLEETSNEKK
jgi:hypothetical protein